MKPRRAGNASPPGASIGNIWRCRVFDNSTPLKMHAQQNPMFGLEITRQTGYNAYGATMFAVLSGCLTRTGPQGVGSALRPAAYMFPKAILTYRGRNCKGVFGKVCKNRLFRFFIDIPRTCWFFRGCSGILAAFGNSRLFLYHFADMLKFSFFLN